MNETSRHHNGGDPYWARVIDIADEFRSPLRNIARGKKWESQAEQFDLIGLAQSISFLEDLDKPRRETEEQKALRQPHKETAEEHALRLSARAFERALLGYRAAVMRAKGWRGNPEAYPLLDGLKDDLAVARRHALPPAPSPAVFIAAAVIRGLLHANQLARLRPWPAPARGKRPGKAKTTELPTGLGSTGIIVGLTCEALDRLNQRKNPKAKPVDPDAIRKELTEHRRLLGV